MNLRFSLLFDSVACLGCKRPLRNIFHFSWARDLPSISSDCFPFVTFSSSLKASSRSRAPLQHRYSHANSVFELSRAIKASLAQGSFVPEPHPDPDSLKHLLSSSRASNPLESYSRSLAPYQDPEASSWRTFVTVFFQRNHHHCTFLCAIRLHCACAFPRAFSSGRIFLCFWTCPDTHALTYGY